MVGNFFAFKKILKEGDGAFYSKYEIIKLVPTQVQLICEVLILKDNASDIDKDIAVAICDNMLIIASQTELRYKDLSQTLQKFDSDSVESKLDL